MSDKQVNRPPNTPNEIVEKSLPPSGITVPMPAVKPPKDVTVAPPKRKE